uniref:Uncharacterized protein n=1 Tax=Aegilops tauschii subsp. strangulata TaxID=200361 RepID=A0A453LBH7_AEGTS
MTLGCAASGTHPQFHHMNKVNRRWMRVILPFDIQAQLSSLAHICRDERHRSRISSSTSRVAAWTPASRSSSSSAPASAPTQNCNHNTHETRRRNLTTDPKVQMNTTMVGVGALVRQELTTMLRDRTVFSAAAPDERTRRRPWRKRSNAAAAARTAPPAALAAATATATTRRRSHAGRRAATRTGTA